MDHGSTAPKDKTEKMKSAQRPINSRETSDPTCSPVGVESGRSTKTGADIQKNEAKILQRIPTERLAYLHLDVSGVAQRCPR